jgi:hypothetical protein
MRMLIFALKAINGLIYPILACLLLAIEDGCVLSAAAFWKIQENIIIIYSRHLLILYYKKNKKLFII